MKSLKSHIRNVHEEVNCVSCEKCGKIFKSNNSKQKHIRKIHQEKKHMCHLCGKSFNSESYVNKHITYVHEGEKIAKCDVCNKVYANDECLKLHVKRQHKFLENLPCNFCEKKFKHKDILYKHIKVVHEKVICSICGKKLTPQYLENHMASVHSIKYTDKTLFLKCEICDKPFAGKWYLNKHMNIHTGATKYKCRYCEKDFTDDSNKRAHERSVHEGKKRLQKKKNVTSNETSFL